MAEYYKTLCATDISDLLAWISDTQATLNAKDKVDHAKVMEEKTRLMDAIFDHVGLASVMKDQGLRGWAEKQGGWLKTYAAFKVQLHKERQFNNKWFDCTTWGVKASQADALAQEGSDFLLTRLDLLNLLSQCLCLGEYILRCT